MTSTVPLLAGTLSTMIFAASVLPMVVKAWRTRDLRSYSRGHLVLANVGNGVHSVYVFDLPPGPIWVLHTFYLVTSALMLAWKVRCAVPRRRRDGAEYATAVAQPAHRRRPGAGAHLLARGTSAATAPDRSRRDRGRSRHPLLPHGLGTVERANSNTPTAQPAGPSYAGRAAGSECRHADQARPRSIAGPALRAVAAGGDRGARSGRGGRPHGSPGGRRCPCYSEPRPPTWRLLRGDVSNA